jgi:hypothetical protein
LAGTAGKKVAPEAAGSSISNGRKGRRREIFIDSIILFDCLECVYIHSKYYILMRFMFHCVHDMLQNKNETL